MKNVFVLLIIFIISCNVPQSQEDTPKENTFTWLMGKWNRSMNGDSVLNHSEVWIQADSCYSGLGTTFINDKLSKEIMTLTKSDDQWIYTAHPQQNEFATSFVVTNYRDSFFRCENESHDFPKYIEYQRKGDSLIASIGDAQQRITFAFSRYE